MAVAPGWAVEIHGEKLDLDDLRHLLVAPFDPWVEDYDTSGATKLLLRSRDWDALSDPAEVHAHAARILALTHGAALLNLPDAHPCTAGAVYHFDAQGKQQQLCIAPSAGHATMRSRVRGRSPLPVPPQESAMQRRLRQSKSSDVQAELLRHISRADNWFDLYKSMELAEKMIGDLQALYKVAGTDAAMWKNVRQTANHYRHAPGRKKSQLPQPPPELRDARLFVLRVIADLL